MSRPKRPLLAGIRDEVAGLSSELGEIVRCHWELARLEAASDLREVRRLAVVVSAAGVAALTGLPLVAAALAWWLRDSGGLGFGAWLALFGSALLLAGAATGYLAWQRFRRRYCGLEETLEELREDAEWLREWTRGEAGSRDGER